MVYPKSVRKTQNKKEHTLYILKGKIKNQTKVKKRCWQGEQDMLLSYCRKARKTKIEIESEIEIKIVWWYLDNYPFGKMNFEINFKMRN